MVALLAVLTLAMFVGIGIYMGWRQRRMARTLAYEKVREGLYFHPGHVWASFQPTGIAKVGIDRFLRGILGRVEEVILPSAGRYVKQGQVVMTVSGSGGRQVHLVSPLDGVVCATNPHPAEGGEISYRNDYLLLIRPTGLSENLSRMKGAEEAEGWFRTELARFKDFITCRMGNLQEVGATLADGGSHTEGIIEKMDEATLTAFTESFLR
jgi:glycine cleavage system H lipoate-binding protein